MFLLLNLILTSPYKNNETIKNINSISLDTFARVIGNIYGATGFYVDNDYNLYVTYNFYPALFPSNTIVSSRNPSNQIYYVNCF